MKLNHLKNKAIKSGISFEMAGAARLLKKDLAFGMNLAEIFTVGQMGD
jgi:hypothetical protein